MKKLLLTLLWFFFFLSPTSAATLLPPGKQQFFGKDGAPLSGGFVYFYTPGTTTPKTTWMDSGQVAQNANPVPLDSAGFAIIYGSGSYREIVQDHFGNVIYDQLTGDTSAATSSWAGTATGSANALTVIATNFSGQNGQSISFVTPFTNTGPASLTIGANSYQIREDSTAGPVPLNGGEMPAGSVVQVTFVSADGTFHLTNPGNPTTFVTVTAAPTTDVAAQGYTNVIITGSATITSFGGSASIYYPRYYVVFTGTNTLTYNAVSLITPNATNILTRANDSAVLQYLGSGNWSVVEYNRALIPQVQAKAVGSVVTNDGVTPNTKISCTAQSVTVVTADGVSFKFSSLSATINTLTTGLNGLDTGGLANNTWYSIFAISDGNTPGCIASLSSTTPTLPANYAAVRIGEMKTDGAAAFYRSKQTGNIFRWIVTAATNTAGIPQFYNNSAGNVAVPTWSAQGSVQAAVGANPAALIPPTARTCTVVIGAQGSGQVVMVAPNTSYGPYTSQSNPPPLMIAATGAIFGDIVMESSSLYLASNNGTNTMFGTIGFLDTAPVY